MDNGNSNPQVEEKKKCGWSWSSFFGGTLVGAAITGGVSYLAKAIGKKSGSPVEPQPQQQFERRPYNNNGNAQR